MTEGGCELTIKVQEVYHVYKQKEVHMKEVLNVLKIIDTAEEKVDVSKEFMEKFLPSQDPVRLTLGNGSADVIGHMSFCRMSPVRVSVEVIVSGNHAIRFEITPSDVPKVDRMNTPDPLIDVFELRRVYRHEFNTDKLKQGHLYLISSKYSKVLAHLDEVTVNRIQITIIRSVEIIAMSGVDANLQQITAESAYDMGLSFEEVCDLDSLDGALK
jgi:hypothetical protein